MRKTVIEPGYGELADGESPASSVGVVVHGEDGYDVTLSGLVAPGGDVETQTRETLSVVREIVCDEFGGELADVTKLRYYVRESALSPESRATIHRVRRQTFEYPHYPAATMVGVAELVADDALLELEAEAFVPYDGWETEVLE